jgi:hypothetical protein
MMTKIFYAPHGHLWVSSAWTTVDADTDLKAQMVAQTGEIEYSDTCTDITISGGENDVDTLHVFGPNGQLLEESRASLVEIEATRILDGTAIAQYYYGAEVSVGSTQFKRVSGTELVGAARPKEAVLLEINDGTNKVHLFLNNAVCVPGDVTLAADGHLEQSLTFKGLVKDYKWEDNI